MNYKARLTYMHGMESALDWFMDSPNTRCQAMLLQLSAP